MITGPHVLISAKPWTLMSNISEEEFNRHFPLSYAVRALTPFDAGRMKLPSDRTFWMFREPFAFVSDKWGRIDIPAGAITDFASVPPLLRSAYDDDSPILLYPSAAHDLLFKVQEDGTRGWLPDGRQLTLRQVNEVLTEAMWYCGASAHQRREVFMAVEIGNLGVRETFAKEDAK